MLTALYNKEELIFVDDFPKEFLKTASDDNLLCCPDCKERLVFKFSDILQPHFSHYQLSCDFPLREPESVEHEIGKNHIYKNALFHDDQNIWKIEHFIEATNQRADVFDTTRNIAIEFQCTPLSDKNFTHRHNLYNSENIPNFWILGYSMHRYTKENNPLRHKLNQIERAVLKTQKRIFYFDTLTFNYILLSPFSLTKNELYGIEYFLPYKEVYFSPSGIHTTKDAFFSIQQERRMNQLAQMKSAMDTEIFLEQIKQVPTTTSTLATKSQVNYIKHLLLATNRKIPYKLHGLKKEEATKIINILLKEKESLYDDQISKQQH